MAVHFLRAPSLKQRLDAADSNPASGWHPCSGLYLFLQQHGGFIPAAPVLMQSPYVATHASMHMHVCVQAMFWTGLIGAVIFRRNLIVMLLATEIVMLACNLNFLFASAYLNDMTVGVVPFLSSFCAQPVYGTIT